MTTFLVAEHNNKSLKDATSKALTAAKAIGGEVVSVHVIARPHDDTKVVLPAFPAK